MNASKYDINSPTQECWRYFFNPGAGAFSIFLVSWLMTRLYC